MRSFAIAIAAAIPALVSAASMTVTVGANSLLAFDPPELNASMGDMISFQFQSKNHSVWQSTFTDPCNLAENGFNSSFMPVNGTSGPFQNFIINVTQATPIWFYCAQTMPSNHCQSGMVGVINPTADKTLAQFKATAMGNSSSGSGSSTPSGGNSTSGGNSSATPPAKPNSAVHVGGGAALLTLVSVIAGITAL